MRNRTVITITGCFLLSVLFVLGLFIYSNPNYTRKNGFSRSFSAKTVKVINSFNLLHDKYYIAGLSKEHIHLGNYENPGVILRLNLNLPIEDTLQLKNINQFKNKWPLFRVAVDSPYVYLGEGVTPNLLRCKLPDLNLKTFIKSSIYFTDYLPISLNSFVMKTYNPKIGQNVLFKENIDTSSVRFSFNALEKQIDGIFCTSGRLSYNRNSKKIIYVYHYRNQFICMDTNLNVLYKKNTIDTNTYAKIKVAKIGNQTTVSSSSVVINKYSSMDEKYFFVNSNLISDNEDKKLFSNSSVIDVYSIEDGQYNFSFYLPNFKNRGLTDLKIQDNKIIVLYKEYLIIYSISM